jgi:hypothetical protein
MSDSGRQPRVEVQEVQLQERSLSAAHDALTVDRVWLPMLVWEDVRVEMRTTRGLTMMERFVIECLLRLDGCGSEDLREIAAIGPELGEWLLTSCVQKSLARRNGDLYHAVRPACEQALERNELPHQVEQRVDILCFPETDEFVLLDDSCQFLQQLRQIQSSGNCPLPLRWQRAERRELLDRAREEGRLYGSRAGVCVVFCDNAVIKDNQCPAYYAGAELREAVETDWAITLIGRRARKKKHLPASSSENQDGAEIVRLPITLPVLTQLKRLWQTMYAAAEDPLRGKLKRMGLPRVERHGAMWTAKVDAAAAADLAARRLLSPNVELEVRLDREVEFSVPFKLVPCDKESRQAFTRDGVVRRVLAAAPHDMIAVATESRDFTLEEVCCRLWQLRFYSTVYQLRQDQDFRT